MHWLGNCTDYEKGATHETIVQSSVQYIYVHAAAADTSPEEAPWPKNTTDLLSNLKTNFTAMGTHCQEESRDDGMSVDIQLIEACDWAV